VKSLKIFGYFILFSFSALILCAVVMTAVLLSLPNVKTLETCFTTSMFKVKLCPGTDQYVKLKQISPFMVHALITAEDGSFYSHKGIDWHELQESLNANLRSGQIRRGGSTLTQQLAKNVFLSNEKSIWRKIKEAYLAYSIERTYPKDVILEKYLNVVEFGPKLYGIKAAAQHYFQKPPSQLHPLEAAYLAFLLPNPKGYSKSFRTGRLTPFARKMVAVILKRMSSFGKLSAPAYQTAISEIGSFPWGELTLASFEGTPTYSLDATGDSGAAALDAETLEAIMRDEGAQGEEFIDFNAEDEE